MQFKLQTSSLSKIIAKIKNVEITNIIIWVIGFILYRYLMTVDIIVGNTLPDMAVTVIICIIVSKFKKAK